MNTRSYIGDLQTKYTNENLTDFNFRISVKIFFGRAFTCIGGYSENQSLAVSVRRFFHARNTPQISTF